MTNFIFLVYAYSLTMTIIAIIFLAKYIVFRKQSEENYRAFDSMRTQLCDANKDRNLHRFKVDELERALQAIRDVLSHD